MATENRCDSMSFGFQMLSDSQLADIHHALETGVLQEGDVRELGKVIVDPALQRTDDSQITVADLTGVAVQDVQISKAVYEVFLFQVS